jgi:hypothetical protein
MLRPPRGSYPPPRPTPPRLPATLPRQLRTRPGKPHRTDRLGSGTGEPHRLVQRASGGGQARGPSFQFSADWSRTVSQSDISGRRNVRTVRRGGRGSLYTGAARRTASAWHGFAHFAQGEPASSIRLVARVGTQTGRRSRLYAALRWC